MRSGEKPDRAAAAMPTAQGEEGSYAENVSQSISAVSFISCLIVWRDNLMMVYF